MKVYGVISREYNSADELVIFSTPQDAFKHFCWSMHLWTDWPEPYDKICQQFRWNEEFEKLQFYFEGAEDRWENWETDYYYDIIWFEVH